MFYILNHENHKFVAVEYPEQVMPAANEMVSNGDAYPDDIEIINAPDEDVRMDMDEFESKWG